MKYVDVIILSTKEREGDKLKDGGYGR